MIVKLLTEHHLEFLSLKEEAQTRLSLHLSKCQIVGSGSNGMLITQLRSSYVDYVVFLSDAIDYRSNPSYQTN